MERVETEVVVPAEPGRAWEAITEPDELAEWLGEEAELDLRPGGDVRVGHDGDERSGFVEEVDEPRRLVFWWAAPEQESTRVEIELEPHPTGTRVRVIETRPLRALSADDARTPELCAAV